MGNTFLDDDTVDNDFINEKVKALKAEVEAKDKLNGEKLIKPAEKKVKLDSITVLDLQKKILDLLHEVDSNPDKHYFMIPELVDGIIAGYIDLHQPTSPNDAAWIEDAIDKAFDQAAREGIFVRPMIKILDSKRDFALSIDYKVYRLDEK